MTQPKPEHWLVLDSAPDWFVAKHVSDELEQAGIDSVRLDLWSCSEATELVNNLPVDVNEVRTLSGDRFGLRHLREIEALFTDRYDRALVTFNNNLGHGYLPVVLLAVLHARTIHSTNTLLTKESHNRWAFLARFVGRHVKFKLGHLRDWFRFQGLRSSQ